MKESEQRLRTIFETTTVNVFIKDHDLRYTMVNPCMAHLFDTSPSEIIGLTEYDYPSKAMRSLLLQARAVARTNTFTFTRVGGEKKIGGNARILAATNRNLEEEVSVGRFRQDLFYRLNIVSVL